MTSGCIIMQHFIQEPCCTDVYWKAGAGCSWSAGLDNPDSDGWIGEHWVWEGACVAPHAQGDLYGFCSYVAKGNQCQELPLPSRVFPRVLLMCFHQWVFSLVFWELGSLCPQCFVLPKFVFPYLRQCHHSTAVCSSAPPGKCSCRFFSSMYPQSYFAVLPVSRVMHQQVSLGIL